MSTTKLKGTNAKPVMKRGDEIRMLDTPRWVEGCSISIDLSDSVSDSQTHEVTAYLNIGEDYWSLESYGESEKSWTPAETIGKEGLRTMREWMRRWEDRAKRLNLNFITTDYVKELIASVEGEE